MTRTSWVLVLGAGGPLGAAWEAGLVAGRAKRQPALHPDLILGTSAGATIGAQLALGRSPQAVFEGQIQHAKSLDTRSNQPPPRTDKPGSSPQPPFVAELVRLALAGQETPRTLLAQIGHQALHAKAMPEERFKAQLRPLFTTHDAWPATFACVAVNAGTGEVVVWDRSSGVELLDAVAASACPPFVALPITIHGQRFMDGGLRSTTNADLADRSARLLVLAPSAVGEMAGPVRAQIDRETKALFLADDEVRIVMPDQASAEAIGPDPLDGTRGETVAQAGFAQGEGAAEDIVAFLAQFP